MKKIALKSEIAFAAYNVVRLLNSGVELPFVEWQYFRNKFGKNVDYIIYNYTLIGHGFKISGCRTYHPNGNIRDAYSNISGDLEFVGYYLTHVSKSDFYSARWAERLAARQSRQKAAPPTVLAC